jgi:hypothetical protein
MVGGLGSFRYRGDLDCLFDLSDRERCFLDRNGERVLKDTFVYVISSVVPLEEFEDVHLEGFFAYGNKIKNFSPYYGSCFNGVFYPKKGIEVRDYVFNSEGEFLTDNHRSCDLVVVSDIHSEVRFLNKEREYIWFPGNRTLSNVINGAYLFKRNPFEVDYPGFREMFEDR